MWKLFSRFVYALVLLIIAIACATQLTNSARTETLEISSAAYDTAIVSVFCNGAMIRSFRYIHAASVERHKLAMSRCINLSINIRYFGSSREARFFENIPGVTEGSTLRLMIGPSYASTYYSVR